MREISKRFSSEGNFIGFLLVPWKGAKKIFKRIRDGDSDMIQWCNFLGPKSQLWTGCIHEISWDQDSVSESVQLLTAAHFWWLPHLPIQQKRFPPTGKSATRSLLESHASLGACFGVSRYFLVFKGPGLRLYFPFGVLFFGGKPTKIMGLYLDSHPFSLELLHI